MRLTESVPATLPLTDDEAARLAALGRRLRGSAAWWGTTPDEERDRSVIEVRRADAPGHWRVTVRNAVGVVGLGDHMIEVRPKIPAEHLLGLLDWTTAVARTVPEPVAVAPGESFWELLARWLVTATERVVRRGLLSDYRAHRAELGTVRGRVDVVATATAFSRGRAVVTCEYDEFDLDNALNRLLLAAARRVAGAAVTSEPTRVRATRVSYAFDGVSALRPGDLHATPDARTRYYAAAVDLAKLVLRGTALNTELGGQRAWTFLLYTPAPVEAGLRALLDASLRPRHTVGNRGLQLVPSTKTLYPDLVFDGGGAVGDVKYRLVNGTAWRDGDLYQVVAFATGYRAKRTLLLTFSDREPGVRHLGVGDVTVTEVRWDARPDTTYAAAAAKCAADVTEWLDG